MVEVENHWFDPNSGMNIYLEVFGFMAFTGVGKGLR